LKIIALLLTAALIAGCSTLQGAKLLAPERFGLTPVAPGIYVEIGADEATRANLREDMEHAADAMRAAYGKASARPIVNACISEACYAAFGGRGSVAKVYGDRILLSPRGLNWHFLAHEWSHVEMRTRLTVSAWLNLPQWFDEGIAVAASEAPEHSEDHWQFLVASNIPRPTREELHALKSLAQWNDAVGRYGEKSNAERKARGEAEIRPVYSAAGHEVRPWLAKVGSAGLLRLIERLNRGEEFESAYDQTAAETNQRGPR
jgi:hypothetical protein